MSHNATINGNKSSPTRHYKIMDSHTNNTIEFVYRLACQPNISIYLRCFYVTRIFSSLVLKLIKMYSIRQNRSIMSDINKMLQDEESKPFVDIYIVL